MCEFEITYRPPSVASTCQFFRATSFESRLARFHGAVSQLPAGELEGLTEVREGRLNVYGLARGTGDVLGVASAVNWTPRIAEVAVWVLDRCHRHGLGTELTRALRAGLVMAGISSAVALIEMSNTAAVALWTKMFPGTVVVDGWFTAALREGAEVPQRPLHLGSDAL